MPALPGRRGLGAAGRRAPQGAGRRAQGGRAQGAGRTAQGAGKQACLARAQGAGRGLPEAPGGSTLGTLGHHFRSNVGSKCSSGASVVEGLFWDAFRGPFGDLQAPLRAPLGAIIGPKARLRVMLLAAVILNARFVPFGGRCGSIFASISGRLWYACACAVRVRRKTAGMQKP